MVKVLEGQEDTEGETRKKDQTKCSIDNLDNSVEHARNSTIPTPSFQDGIQVKGMTHDYNNVQPEDANSTLTHEDLVIKLQGAADAELGHKTTALSTPRYVENKSFKSAHDSFFHFNDRGGFWFDFQNKLIPLDSNATIATTQKSCIEDDIEGINSLKHKLDFPLIEADREHRPSDFNDLGSQLIVEDEREEASENCSSHGTIVERNFDSCSSSSFDHNWRREYLLTAENEIQVLTRMDDAHGYVGSVIHSVPRGQEECNISLADLQNMKNTIEEIKTTFLNVIHDRDMASKVVDEAIDLYQGTKSKLKAAEIQIAINNLFREQENRERAEEIEQDWEEHQDYELLRLEEEVLQEGLDCKHGSAVITTYAGNFQRDTPDRTSTFDEPIKLGGEWHEYYEVTMKGFEENANSMTMNNSSYALVCHKMSHMNFQVDMSLVNHIANARDFNFRHEDVFIVSSFSQDHAMMITIGCMDLSAHNDFYNTWELDVDENLPINESKGIREVSINQIFRFVATKNCEEMCVITFGDMLKTIPHFMLSMLNDIRDSGTYMGDRVAHDSRVSVWDYIKVVQQQHGGSFLSLIWNPGITWVCSSIVEGEEANVGLLGFTPMVF
ncbi:hypothetical protein SUGI_1113910 [Cryptomeria japonica]|nr:hypothetical protein SUGI_1113910 [Cryptomeria japonica]